MGYETVALDMGRAETLFREKREAFNAFFKMLLEYNAKYNLTAITEEEEVNAKHFLNITQNITSPPSRRKRK